MRPPARGGLWGAPTAAASAPVLCRVPPHAATAWLGHASLRPALSLDRNLRSSVRGSIRAFRSSRQPQRQPAQLLYHRQLWRQAAAPPHLCRYSTDPAAPAEQDPLSQGSEGARALGRGLKEHLSLSPDAHRQGPENPGSGVAAVAAGSANAAATAVEDAEGSLLSQPEDVREVLRLMRRACCGVIPDGHELVQQGRGTYLGLDVSWEVTQQASGAFLDVGSLAPHGSLHDRCAACAVAGQHRLRRGSSPRLR